VAAGGQAQNPQNHGIFYENRSWMDRETYSEVKKKTCPAEYAEQALNF
jgi:hypothetical protein